MGPGTSSRQMLSSSILTTAGPLEIVRTFADQVASLAAATGLPVIVVSQWATASAIVSTEAASRLFATATAMYGRPSVPQ